MARGPRFWALGVDSGPRGGAFEVIVDPPKSQIIYSFIGAQMALESIPWDNFSLIYAAFIKPGPLGRLLGPTLAENPSKTEKN